MSTWLPRLEDPDPARRIHFSISLMSFLRINYFRLLRTPVGSLVPGASSGTPCKPLRSASPIVAKGARKAPFSTVRSIDRTVAWRWVSSGHRVRSCSCAPAPAQKSNGRGSTGNRAANRTESRALGPRSRIVTKIESRILLRVHTQLSLVKGERKACTLHGPGTMLHTPLT